MFSNQKDNPDILYRYKIILFCKITEIVHSRDIV